MEIIYILQTDMRCETNKVVERTVSDWIELLLGLYEGSSGQMADVVNEFLERMCCSRHN